jgi:hypothetical protein
MAPMRVIPLVLAVAVVLGLGRAEAQSIHDVAKIDDVATIVRLFVARDGSWHVAATRTDDGERVVISSTHPKRPIGLPQIELAGGLTFTSAKRGAIATWIAEGKVHHLSTATGKVVSRAIPERIGDLAERAVTGDDGTILIRAKYGLIPDDRVPGFAVLSPSGKEIRLDPKLFATADLASLTEGSAYLKVSERSTKMDGWHYSLAKRKRIDGAPAKLPKPIEDEAYVEHRRHIAGAPYGSEVYWNWKAKKLEILWDGPQPLWSLDETKGLFAIQNDAIVLVRQSDSGWTLQRIEFDGGLSAWAIKGGEVAKRERDEKWKADREAADKKKQHDKEDDEKKFAKRMEDYKAKRALELAEEKRQEAERKRQAANRPASPSPGSTSSRSTTSRASAETIEDAARRLMRIAKEQGKTLESSEFGTSNQSNPVRMKQRLKGRFIAIVVVDKRAVNAVLAVKENGQYVSGSFESLTLDGWVVSGQGFATGDSWRDVSIEGRAYSGNAYPTAVMLFSQ